MPLLAWLDLSHNRLRLVPAALAGCAALRHLDLSSNAITHGSASALAAELQHLPRARRR